MAQQVNLDALISREDFEVETDSNQSSQITTIQIRDLEPAAFFSSVVRKPDFQRETSEWQPKKIAEFITSFIAGDLIPALILWQSGNNIFVIDGAHRLSALLSWVRDDYGDGDTSKLFFEGRMPDDQIKVAESTRRLVNKTIGKYTDHQFAIAHPERSDDRIIQAARRLASLAIQLQWVKGDSTVAEQSFFKINQQASPIDKTELRLLKARRKPNAIAARAIIRSGTGHKYWSKFDDVVVDEIERIARHIHETLFQPELKTPIKTLDLPIAGRGYSARVLPLIFEFVNLTNGGKGDSSQEDDIDGSDTIRHLKSCRKVVDRISGTHPGSLGLHPAVYFYSENGRYQQTSFLAMVGVVSHLETKDLFGQFSTIRKQFEDFLIKYKVFPKQLVLKIGSGAKGFGRLRDLWLKVIELMLQGKSEDQILEAIASDKALSFLQPKDNTPDDNVRSNFSTDTKSAVFLREALQTPVVCNICGGLIHQNSISIDHVLRKEDGGQGIPENGALTHPYCNTTVKN